MTLRSALDAHRVEGRVFLEFRVPEGDIAPELAALKIALSVEQGLGKAGFASELRILEGRLFEEFAGVEAGGR